MVGVNEEKRLIGRSDVLESILGCLNGAGGGGGTLVVAGPGIGKSAIARAVAHAMDPGAGLVQLAASASLCSVPFGTLAPLLSDPSIADLSSPMAVIRGVTKFFARVPVPASSLPIVIVDDAHWLDESSAAVLAQMVSAGVMRLLALARCTPGAPQEILSLWHDGLLTRINLEPLPPAQVQELCVGVLGASIVRSASAALARTSAGNPMFLLALITQARAHNHLVQRRGGWILSGELPMSDLRLSDLVKTDLSRLSTSEREVLEIVALAEPLPLGVLRRLASTTEIDALVTGNFVSVGPDSDRLVRPAYPLYGEVVRQYVPAGRRLAFRKRVVELTDTEPSSADGLLRYVSWALDTGAAVASRQLLRAAVVANKLFQTTFALRAAAAVTEPKYRLAAEVEMARAYYTRGEFAAAEELLPGVVDCAPDLRTAASAALLAAQLRIRRGVGLGELHMDAHAWSEVTERIASADVTGEFTQAVRLSRSGSRLLHLYASIFEGHYAGAEPELRHLTVDPEGSDETRLVALVLLGELLTATGDPVSGARFQADALAIVLHNDHRFLNYYNFVVFRYTISLASSGRWDEAQSLMARYLAESPQSLIYSGGSVNVATGLVLLRQGLLHSALGELSPAIEALRQSDLELLLPLALGLGAYAAALLGERAQALAYAEDFLRVPYSGSRQLYLIGQAHAVAARVAIEGFGPVGEKLLHLADVAAISGMRSVGQLALELAVRLGATSAFELLADVASRNEGADAHLLVRLATAAQGKDAVALGRISEDAAQAGYLLIAADCLALAGSILAAQGHGQLARAARTQLSEHVSRLEGITLYEIDGSEISVLTRREREVARLVLEGRSNREVADALSVSVRTVEGHLYRIFVKLSISRREELANVHLGQRPWAEVCSRKA